MFQKGFFAMSIFRYAFLFIKDGIRPWIDDRYESGLQHWRAFGGGYKAIAASLVFGGSILYLLIWYRVVLKERQKPLPLESMSNNDDNNNNNNAHFDVCIVGGGPAGLSTAYYAASSGMRVIVLEKCLYPRDKVCGDVVIPAVQQILKEMGIWQRIMERGAYRWVNKVALVRDVDTCSVTGSLRSHRPITVQRIVLDYELSLAARQAGAHVAQGHLVTGAVLDADVWNIQCENGATFKSSVLVCADGAKSWLARSLGVIQEPPNAMGYRVFLAPEHGNQIQVDYILRVDENAICSSVVREVDDYMCQTVVDATNGEESNPPLFFFQNLPRASQFVDQCEMRVGGVSKAFSNQLLVVGDAAGLCDPLTGFGIIYSLQSGRAAARTLVDGLSVGDLSEVTLCRYQSRINQNVDFTISKAIQKMLRVYPLLTTACIAVIRSRGILFFSEWVGSLHYGKKWFITPHVAFTVLFEAMKQGIIGIMK